ncbi:MAG: hypothetical protein R3B06_15620 [Kofleriaceae bacterium]
MIGAEPVGVVPVGDGGVGLDQRRSAGAHPLLQALQHLDDA